MINARTLLISFTDQGKCGFSGKNGIELNYSLDLDENWYMNKQVPDTIHL